MEIKDLRPNPRNPRVVSERKLSALKRALAEFGDLGGFVFNRTTKQLVGGHQRVKAFDKNAEVVIERKVKGSKVGTVAEGYVLLNGERFKYREVSWDEHKEKAANIAANKDAGEWDSPVLASWLEELQDFGVDTDLTLFDKEEIKGLRPIPIKPPKVKLAPDAPKEKKRVTCPECHAKFVPGWS